MTLRVMGNGEYLLRTLPGKVKVRGGHTVIDTEKLDQETVDQVFESLMKANFLAFDAAEKEKIKIQDLRDQKVSPEEVIFAAPMAGG